MKIIVKLLLVVFLGVTLSSYNSIDVSAAQTTGITSGSIYNFKNVNSSKYLNVNMGYDVNNANVYQWTKDGSTEQKFKIVYDSANDAYRFYAVCSSNGTNRVLDIVKSSGAVVNGCNVQIYNPTDPTAQLWQIVSLGS